jgi:hypothetical protein
MLINTTKTIWPQRTERECWGFSPLQPRPTPCGYREHRESQPRNAAQQLHHLTKKYLSRFRLRLNPTCKVVAIFFSNNHYSSQKIWIKPPSVKLQLNSLCSLYPQGAGRGCKGLKPQHSRSVLCGKYVLNL